MAVDSDFNCMATYRLNIEIISSEPPNGLPLILSDTLEKKTAASKLYISYYVPKMLRRARKHWKSNTPLMKKPYRPIEGY